MNDLEDRLINIITDCWLGLAHLNFHGLRHTHATLLLGAGVDVKAVSERLGHASVAFTLDTYSHVTPGLQQAAAESFDKLVNTRHENVAIGNY